MLLKGIGVFLAFFIIGVAIFGYTPLPDGITDPYKVHVITKIWGLQNCWFKIRELLGYGSFLNTMSYYQDQLVLEGEPASAKYGDVKVTRDKIAGVPVIVYHPDTATSPSPALVFIHGGGWTFQSADTADETVYHYAKCTNTIVFSVDYRRAPQFPFPAGVNDCLDVTRYVLRHGKHYGVDVTKVGVAGESSGANQAAAVALALSKEKNKLLPLMFQVLHSPPLQAFDFRLPSYVDINDTMAMLPARLMAAFYSYYMGLDETNTEYYATVLTENRHISPQLRKSKFAEYVDVKLLPKRFQTPNKTVVEPTAPYDQQVFNKIKQIVTNPLFSPLMSSDLSSVPATFIHVSEFDVLRDDSLLYAKRLQIAGVKVKLFYGTGGYHGDIVKELPGFLYTSSGEAALSAGCAFVKKMVKDSS